MTRNYFSDSELACKCCGTIRLGTGFLERLNLLRQAWGKPITPTSVCRCPTHNAKVGGKPSSFHLTSHPWGCVAMDISTAGWSSADRHAFVMLAGGLGFSIGINWAKGFIHIDDRARYPQAGWPKPVIFPY